MLAPDGVPAGLLALVVEDEFALAETIEMYLRGAGAFYHGKLRGIPR